METVEQNDIEIIPEKFPRLNIDLTKFISLYWENDEIEICIYP